MEQFVLVAGMDYEFKGVDFRLFANNRIKRVLLANKARKDHAFHILDVRAGEIETTEVTFAGSKETKKVTKTKPFRALVKANFDAVRDAAGDIHRRFKPGQTDVMSVLDVYKAVQDIGKNAAGTLKELSFFSHGWMGGPILVNSFDDRSTRVSVPGPPVLGGPTRVEVDMPIPAPLRDPDDKDPRTPLDFIAPTMDAGALKLFQDAFHADGHSWAWGCAFPRLIHQILHRVEGNKAYKRSGMGNDVLMTFTNFRDDEIDVLERFLAGRPGIPFPNRRKIEIKFKVIKFFICQAVQTTYSHHLAVQSKRRVFAAPLGTYSEYDTGKLPLMNVYAGFGRHFTFYKNYMGLNFDPENRRYAEHLPSFTCTVPGP